MCILASWCSLCGLPPLALYSSSHSTKPNGVFSRGNAADEDPCCVLHVRRDDFMQRPKLILPAMSRTYIIKWSEFVHSIFWVKLFLWWYLCSLDQQQKVKCIWSSSLINIFSIWSPGIGASVHGIQIPVSDGRLATGSMMCISTVWWIKQWDMPANVCPTVMPHCSV